MSRLHSLGLQTPVAHVGIAVVEEEGNSSGNVYIFESGAPRGSQLRNIDDYMREGAERLWWKQLKASNEQREDVIKAIEASNSVAYSWSFLQRLPTELLGIETPGILEEDEHACSCADLLARIYSSANVLKSNRKSWLPMHFLESSSSFEAPINVVFQQM